jgi:hypothetical protein
LRAKDEWGEPLAEVKVAARFKLTERSAEDWVRADFANPMLADD